MRFSVRAAARSFLQRRRGKKIRINYANETFRAKQALNSETGRTVAGFDVVRSFGPGDIDATFAEANAAILSLLARKAGIETIPDISQWGNERDRFRKGIGQVMNLVR